MSQNITNFLEQVDGFKEQEKNAAQIISSCEEEERRTPETNYEKKKEATKEKNNMKGLGRKLSFGGAEVPENKEKISLKNVSSENSKPPAISVDEVPVYEKKLSLPILSNKTEDELERCICKIIELQGEEKFWREVQGIQTRKKFYHNTLTDEIQWIKPRGYQTLMKEPESEYKVKSPEHEKLLDKLMHLADLDNNGTIDEEELIHNETAATLLENYFKRVNKNFLTKADIVELLPELKDLENLVKKLESCLSDAEYDPFLLNKRMKPIEATGHEKYEIIGKHEILSDERQRTVFNQNSNFTVLLESLTCNNLYLGSGFLVSEGGQIWVITAGHCVGTLETGIVTKMNDIRIRCPVLPDYNDDLIPHARDKKTDHRLKDYYVDQERIFIYPYYIEDANCRGGTDVGMIKLPESYHSNTDALDIEQIRVYNPSERAKEIFLNKESYTTVRNNSKIVQL